MTRPAQACLLALAAAVAACAEVPPGDVDRGPVEAIVGAGERVSWPGFDHASVRVIPLLHAFAHGAPAAYWFLGFGSRRTADAYFICRQEDARCPLDDHRRLDWRSIVGRPVFARIPAESEYSPFWQMWKVTVPGSFREDSVKSVETLLRLAGAGVVAVEPLVPDFGRLAGESVGPRAAVLHGAAVLAGTELEQNGGPVPDGAGSMLRLERRLGWYRGYRVEFIDFSPSDGVLPAAADRSAGDDRPRMRFANIYVLWRRCGAAPRPAICDLPGAWSPDRRPVSERGLGQDLTGDGSASDTNNVLGATPCDLRRPTERPYSPLWAPFATDVVPPFSPGLIDTYRSRVRSDIASADVLYDAVADGRLAGPAAMREDETGNPVPGNDGQIFFNCPSPVPLGFVPYPCEAGP